MEETRSNLKLNQQCMYHKLHISRTSEEQSQRKSRFAAANRGSDDRWVLEYLVSEMYISSLEMVELNIKLERTLYKVQFKGRK